MNAIHAKYPINGRRPRPRFSCGPARYQGDPPDPSPRYQDDGGSEDHHKALAEHYAEFWNELEAAGLEPTEIGVWKVADELVGGDWCVYHDSRDNTWKVAHAEDAPKVARYSNAGQPIRYARRPETFAYQCPYCGNLAYQNSPAAEGFTQTYALCSRCGRAFSTLGRDPIQKPWSYAAHIRLVRYAGYNPNEPRDEDGKWTEGGGRVNLKVSYYDREKAKRCGARWDPAKKVWYAPNAKVAEAVNRVLPGAAPGAGERSGDGAPKRQKQESQSKTTAGSMAPEEAAARHGRTIVAGAKPESYSTKGVVKLGDIVTTYKKTPALVFSVGKEYYVSRDMIDDMDGWSDWPEGPGHYVDYQAIDVEKTPQEKEAEAARQREREEKARAAKEAARQAAERLDTLKKSIADAGATVETSYSPEGLDHPWQFVPGHRDWQQSSVNGKPVFSHDISTSDDWRSVYYMPPDVFRDAVMSWAKQVDMTVERAKEWMEKYGEGVWGGDGYKLFLEEAAKQGGDHLAQGSLYGPTVVQKRLFARRNGAARYFYDPKEPRDQTGRWTQTKTRNASGLYHKQIDDYNRGFLHALGGKDMDPNGSESYTRGHVAGKARRADSPVPYAGGSACPHCGKHGHGGLLPPDFESAHCNACGKVFQPLSPVKYAAKIRLLRYDTSNWGTATGGGPKRIPRGYVVYKDGRVFRAGMWVSEQDLATAVPAQTAGGKRGEGQPHGPVEEARRQAAYHHEKRRARGQVNRGKLTERATEHLHHELSPQEATRARRTFAGLYQHHGELTAHRIEELLNATHTALQHAHPNDEETRARLGKRIKAYHDMLEWFDKRQSQREPWKGGTPEHEGKVYRMPTGEIHADPERFQFKLNVDKSGVTEELKGVRKFNPVMAGVIHVWKDPADGRTYVVNGHHRLELAKRLKHPNLNVMYVNAPDHKQARAIGAQVNIAEGRGTAVDAAKYMRDTGMTPADMENEGISLKGKLAADAVTLTGLNDRLFNRVARGQMPVDQALIIAGQVKDHDLQDLLANRVEKEEAKGRDVSPRLLSEMARKCAESPKIKLGERGGERGLFDDLEAEDSVFVEECDLQAYVRAELAKDVNDWKAVASKRRVGKVSAEGKNVLDVEANKANAEDAATARATFDRLVNRHGLIADAIKQHAVEYAKANSQGEKNAIRQRALAAVREAIDREESGQTDATREATGATGGEAAAQGNQPVPAAQAAAGSGRGSTDPHGLTDKSYAKQIAEIMDRSPGYGEDQGAVKQAGEEIGSMPGLTEAERAIETRAKIRALNDFASLRQRYIDANATKNPDGSIKSIALNTDEWRELFDGYTGTNAHAVHEPASYANKKLLDEMLVQQKGKGNNTFTVFAGGGGSGKGTAIKEFFDEEKYPIRLDQVTDKYKKASELFDRAKSHGYKPEFIFVDRKPHDAWQGVIGRALKLREENKPARTVPIDIAMKANIEARRTGIEILKNRPDVTPYIIDNVNGQEGKRRLIEDRAEAIAYLEKRLQEDEKQFDETHNYGKMNVWERYQAGEIPEDIAKGLLGPKLFEEMSHGSGKSSIPGREAVPAYDAGKPQSERPEDDRRRQSGRDPGDGGEWPTTRQRPEGSPQGVRGKVPTTQAAGGESQSYRDLKAARRVAEARGEHIIRPANSLGIARADMPQIAFKHHAEFIKGLNDEGIDVKAGESRVGDLKPTQAELNTKQMDQMDEGKVREGYIFTSNDGYVLDGHHRWGKLLDQDPNNTINTRQVDLPIRELLAKANAFSKVGRKDVNEVGKTREPQSYAEQTRQAMTKGAAYDPNGKEGAPPPTNKPVTLVFGGSFSPFHTAHLGAIKDAKAWMERNGYKVGRIVISPSSDKLLRDKLGDDLVPLPHRVEMIRKAIAGDPDIEVTSGPAEEAENFQGKLKRTMLADWAARNNPGTTVVNVTGEDAVPSGAPGVYPSVFSGGGSHEGYYYLGLPRESGGLSSSKIRKAVKGGEQIPAEWMHPDAAEHYRNYLKNAGKTASANVATEAPKRGHYQELIANRAKELVSRKGPESQASPPAAGGAVPRGVKGTILGHLARSGANGVSPDALKSAMGEHAEHVDEAIRQMAIDGRVEERGGRLHMAGAGRGRESGYRKPSAARAKALETGPSQFPGDSPSQASGWAAEPELQKKVYGEVSVKPESPTAAGDPSRLSSYSDQIAAAMRSGKAFPSQPGRKPAALPPKAGPDNPLTRKGAAQIESQLKANTAAAPPPDTRPYAPLRDPGPEYGRTYKALAAAGFVPNVYPTRTVSGRMLNPKEGWVRKHPETGRWEGHSSDEAVDALNRELSGQPAPEPVQQPKRERAPRGTYSQKVDREAVAREAQRAQDEMELHLWKDVPSYYAQVKADIERRNAGAAPASSPADKRLEAARRKVAGARYTSLKHLDRDLKHAREYAGGLAFENAVNNPAGLQDAEAHVKALEEKRAELQAKSQRPKSSYHAQVQASRAAGDGAPRPELASSAARVSP